MKAKIRTLQSIGRILRTTDGKGEVKLIDVVDDFSYMRGKTEQSNIVMKHFHKRIELYENEEFDYDITEYNL